MSWIKVTESLLTSPKVDAIVTSLSDVTSDVTDRNAVIVCLLRVWMAANQHASADDGETIRHASLVTLDNWAGVSGFGAAMASVGWVTESPGSITLTGFSEHNTASKKRLNKTGAARQKAYRERKALRNGDVTRDVTRDVTVTIEKRREEQIVTERESAGATSALGVYPDPREYPSVETVRQWAEQIQAPAAVADEWHATRVAEGWLNSRGNGPLSADHAALRAYFVPWANKAKSRAPTPSASPYAKPRRRDIPKSWTDDEPKP